MTLRLEKIALVFKVRVVPTSSEDSWTIIFVCPYILWFKKVQVALGLTPPQRGPSLNFLPWWRYLILANDASPMLRGRSCACVSTEELHAQ